jgi:hypothetical protein
MKARRLIQGASFGPETLKVIGQTFDEAWDSIAANFGDNPVAIEAARLKLANAVLGAAREESRDVKALKRDALAAMLLGEPLREREISN